METNGTGIPKRYLNIDEAANYLGTSTTTLYRLVESRSIPFIKFGGKISIKFDMRALDKWMEKQLIPAKPQLQTQQLPE